MEAHGRIRHTRLVFKFKGEHPTGNAQDDILASDFWVRAGAAQSSGVHGLAKKSPCKWTVRRVTYQLMLLCKPSSVKQYPADFMNRVPLPVIR